MAIGGVCRIPAVLALIGVVFAAIGPGGATASDAVTCGATITASTTLSADLACPGDALVIAGTGVTLDLGGHAVSGSGGGTGIAVTAASVTVQNGSVRGFDVGIRVAAGAATVDGITADWNGRGLRALGAAGGTVSDSDFSHNTLEGVWLRANGWTVEGSQISHNGGDGLFAFSGSQQLMVTGNHAILNGGSGIHLADFDDLSTVSGNVASANDGDGITVSSSTGSVTGNTVSHNAGNGITRSECCGLLFAANEVIADNVADSNSGHGIEACTALVTPGPCGPGIVDGGGNLAKHNDLIPECVNIVCEFSPGAGAGHALPTVPDAPLHQGA